MAPPPALEPHYRFAVLRPVDFRPLVAFRAVLRDDLRAVVVDFFVLRLVADRLLAAFREFDVLPALLVDFPPLDLAVERVLRALGLPDFERVALELRVGSFFRFTDAIFSSSFSLIDSTMLREAPRRDDLDFSPRFADNAAPAALCCFLDFAGILE